MSMSVVTVPRSKAKQHVELAEELVYRALWHCEQLGVRVSLKAGGKGPMYRPLDKAALHFRHADWN